MTDLDLIGADEAARVAGVNRRTITKWADDGVLPVATRLPGGTGARLFDRLDVVRIAKERRDARLAALTPSPEGAEA